MKRAIVLALLGLACCGAAPAVRAATLTIVPAETTVTVGDPFVVRVMVDPVPDLKGAELIHGYTSGRLSFVSAQAGDALTGATGSVSEFVLPDVTAPADSVWYNGARLDGTGAGPGVVIFLAFATHTEGNATIDCLTSDLRDSANAPLAPSCAGALVHVIGPVPVRSTSWGRLKEHYR